MFSFDITFSGITSLLNFIKLLIGSKVICGDTDKQHGDLTSRTFSFRESTLKKHCNLVIYFPVSSFS
jgi:hypothetical protein